MAFNFIKLKYIYFDVKLAVLIIFITCSLQGCKKWIEVSPVTSIASSNVYSNDAAAIAAVTAIYTNISNGTTYSANFLGTTGLTGLSSDELTLYSGVSGSPLNYYYANNLNNNDGLDFWTQIYQIVYLANASIEGLTNNNNITNSIQQELLGEAEFDRAFCYFYLVNLYGDVPLVLTTNYKINATLARTPAVMVWQQIIQDLHNSAAILSPVYLDGTLTVGSPQRVRPIKWAAEALLARAYLYTSNWIGADSASSTIIDNSGLYSLDSLNSVFQLNSTEAIWQIQPINQGYDTWDAFFFDLPSTGPNTGLNLAYLNDSLAYTFEPNDERRINWIDSVNVGGMTYFFPYKYKNDTVNGNIDEYATIMRLGEQYLIRAESEAELNNLNDAATDLNVIRSRAGLGPTSAVSQPDLISAIMHERRVELFAELGHRWLDLKRIGAIDSVMTAVCVTKGTTWKSSDQWYPIPLYDLQYDPKLVQNAGY